MIMYTHTNWDYCLVRDDDTHWFLIPVNRRKYWEEVLDLFNQDKYEGFFPPPWAEPIDGPHNLIFSNPRSR